MDESYKRAVAARRAALRRERMPDPESCKHFNALYKKDPELLRGVIEDCLTEVYIACGGGAHHQVRVLFSPTESSPTHGINQHPIKMQVILEHEEPGSEASIAAPELFYKTFKTAYLRSLGPHACGMLYPLTPNENNHTVTMRHGDLGLICGVVNLVARQVPRPPESKPLATVDQMLAALGHAVPHEECRLER